MQSWDALPLTGWADLGMVLSASELHGFVCMVRAQTDFFLLSQSHRTPAQ